MIGRRLYARGVAAIVLLWTCNAEAHLNKNTEKTAAKAIVIALPVAAYAISYAHHEDWTGIKELTVVTAATIGSTLLIREFVHKRSPDGSTDRAFPSLEASFASPASGYLWRRYGWCYGLPAFVLGQGANLLLDDAGKHRIWDGLAVTALAAGFNFLITTPYYRTNFYVGAAATSQGPMIGMGYRF